jgi:hypothetical protein
MTQTHRSAAPFNPLLSSARHLSSPPVACLAGHRTPSPPLCLATRCITEALTPPPLLPLPRARVDPVVPIFPSPRFRCHRALPSPPILVAPSCPILSAPPPPPTHPYHALPFPSTGGHLLSSDCAGSLPLSPAPGGSRLRARPLPSLDFISWLTSSSLSRCCRSCPWSSTVIVGAHRR